jgi:hypothetical protein
LYFFVIQIAGWSYRTEDTPLMNITTKYRQWQNSFLAPP